MSTAISHNAEVSPSDGVGIVPRPPFQLRSLPISTRWEVTRRHPYYQAWWKWTPSCDSTDSEKTRTNLASAESLLRDAGAIILGAIGVSRTPPDPATEFEQLGAADLNAAWLSGVLHPTTMRGLAAILIASLSKETLRSRPKITRTLFMPPCGFGIVSDGLCSSNRRERWRDEG